MKFYYISSEYLKYLYRFEPRIGVRQLKDSRPYIGIVLRINNVNYYAPLHSYRSQKHDRISDRQLDFMRIKNKNGFNIGAINFSSMIPVNDADIYPIDFNEIKDEKLRNKFYDEYAYCKKYLTRIKTKANAVYRLSTVNKIDSIAKRCYDFKLLEKKCKEYLNLPQKQ